MNPGYHGGHAPLAHRVWNRSLRSRRAGVRTRRGGVLRDSPGAT